VKPRLKEKYEKEIIPKMMEEFSYRNVMEVPRLEKITVNMGVGSAIQNIKEMDRIFKVGTRTSSLALKYNLTAKKRAVIETRLRVTCIGCLNPIFGAIAASWSGKRIIARIAVTSISKNREYASNPLLLACFRISRSIIKKTIIPTTVETPTILRTS
jgi:hypothetical protein